MRHLLLLLAGLLGLVLLLCGGFAAFLLTADLRAHIERWAARETGRTVHIGSLRIDWGLRTRVALGDLKLGNARWGRAPQMIEIGALFAEVDLWSLLAGAPRYERLTIDRLTVVLERGPQHVGNWKMGEGGTGTGGLVPKNRAEVPTLIDFAIETGLLIYRDDEIGLELRIEADRIGVAAADRNAPMRITWRGAYNGTATTLEAEGQSFSVLRRRNVPFGATATLASEGNSLFLQGTMMEPLDFEGVTGALRAELPDLGAFLAILGAGIDLPVPLRVEGHFEHEGDRWRLSEAKGALAENGFAGALRLDEAPRGKPDALDLDLRFGRLDLEKLLPRTRPKQPLGQIRLELPAGKVGMEARITAGEVAWGGLAGTDAELRGRRGANGFHIDRVRARLFGGSIAGNGSAEPAESGTRLLLAGEFDRLDLEKVAKWLGTDTAGITGRVAGRTELAGDGPTLGAVLAGLRGHGVLALAEGRIPRALVEKVTTNLLSLFRDKAGFSAVTCFLGLLEISKGTGHWAPLRLRTPDTTVSARGWVDFRQLGMDMTILTDQPGGGPFALNIPLQVRGPWTGPGVSPLAGSPAPARRPDLAALPPASRALVESSPCLK